MTLGQYSAYSRGDLALGQIMLGQLDAAADTLRTAFELFPKGHYLPYVYLALLHEARGDFAGAVRALSDVPVKSDESVLIAGLASIGTGDLDLATQWFTESFVTERDPISSSIAVMPLLRHIHAHPGFRSLVTGTLRLRFPADSSASLSQRSPGAAP